MSDNNSSTDSVLNMEQSIDVLRIQRDLAIALSETSDIEEALSLILNSMIKMPEVDSGGIYFVNRNTKSLEMTLSVGLSEMFQDKVGYYPGDSPQADMVNAGKPLFSGPDFPIEQFEPTVVDEGLTAVAALPICRGNIAVACCNVSSHTVNEFSEFTKAALESITELLGTAVTRIASEDALWDVVQRYQRMFMNMHNGVAVFREVDNGRDFVFTDYNSAAERMDGKKKEDILGMRVSKVFPGVFASGIGKLFKQVLETGEPVSYGPLLYSDDSLRAWREGYIYRLSSGELVSIYDDVTDQIEAKMELHRINEMLNTVMQSAPLPVFTLDLDGNVTDIWNPAAEDFLGWTKEEVQGKRLPTITDEIRDEFQRFLDWMRSGTGMPGVEVKRNKRDGSEVEYSIYGAPLRDSENQISGYVVMLIDLTEKKETEQILQNYREHLEELVDERTKELEQAREKLIESERLALLGNFAGGIAHEIRNPLSVISSAAFFLKRKLNSSDEKVNNNIERISRQVENATAIIDSILRLTRLDEPVKAPVKLMPLIEQAVKAARVPDNIEIEMLLEPESMTVEADRDQLRIAMKNLIKNSLQAIEPGGKISIEASCDTIDDKHINRIILRDSGFGIQEDIRDKIFQPLFTTRTRGIGFGLSIVKMVVEKHGGEISVRNNRNGGARFEILLPAG